MRVARVLLFGGMLACGAAPSWAQPPAPPGARRDAFLAAIDRPRVPAAPSTPTVAERNGYREERLSIASAAGQRVPLLLLRQGTRSGRLPVVLVLHGTNGSKEQMRDWLEPLADRGLLAVAMDAPHHGERSVAIPGLANPYQSALLRTFRTGEGRPYLYDTVWDVMRVVDYLVTREDVDGARLGLLGSSKGGTEAYLAAAADPRFSVVVPMIGVQSFGWSLGHASAWEARAWTLRQAIEAAAADAGVRVDAAFVRRFLERVAPGVTDRFDGPAMLPLIAPRALLVVNGDSDPRSPIGSVKHAARAADEAYTAAGAREKFELLLQEDTAHEVAPAARERVLGWFGRWLIPAGH